MPVTVRNDSLPQRSRHVEPGLHSSPHGPASQLTRHVAPSTHDALVPAVPVSSQVEREQ